MRALWGGKQLRRQSEDGLACLDCTTGGKQNNSDGVMWLWLFCFLFRDKEQKQRRGLGLEERNSASLSCLWVSRSCRNYILCLLYVTRLLLFTGKYLYPHFQKDIYIYKKKYACDGGMNHIRQTWRKKKEKKALWHLSSRPGVVWVVWRGLVFVDVYELQIWFPFTLWMLLRT